MTIKEKKVEFYEDDTLVASITISDDGEVTAMLTDPIDDNMIIFDSYCLGADIEDAIECIDGVTERLAVMRAFLEKRASKTEKPKPARKK